MPASWAERLEELLAFLDRHDPNRGFRFEGEAKEVFDRLSRGVKKAFIREAVGASSIKRAKDWIKTFRDELDRCARALGARGFLLSKELKSFIEDPEAHLEKKLQFYLYDLLRGRVSREEFEEKGRAAVTTSLMTNLRSVYQDWVLLALWSIMAEDHGAEIAYPEHRCLHLERLGRQRLGEINPNLILHVWGRGSLSFFLEAPRPVGWEDTSDLMKAWRLYVALRPDIMVHGGLVMNLVDPSRDPPIAPPDVIIECKELVDWYIRVRDVKGPLAKPLTVEEWRSKWIQGLYEGLADILGVTPSKAAERVKEQRGLRLREDHVVVLYRSFYRPRAMYLVCRARTPGDVKRYLEGEGVTVIDGVGFRRDALRVLAEEVVKVARPSTRLEELSARLLSTLSGAGVKLTPQGLVESALRYVEERLQDFAGWLKNTAPPEA